MNHLDHNNTTMRRSLTECTQGRGKSALTPGAILTEVRSFATLAVPTVILQLGFTLSPFLTASYVGRKYGAVYLSGFTLANLTGNLFTLSLLSGLLSASDTLSPRAFGAGNHKEVGLIAMRGFIGSLCILVPTNLLLVPYLEPLLIHFGQDPEAAVHASQWYQIYVFALPFYALYNVTWKFLSAQNIMNPLLYVCLFTCLIVLPLLLEFFTAAFGFLGSAIAFTLFQASQAILLILYLWWNQPHVAATWPGIHCWREAMEYKRMKEFFSLAAGGMLAQSEWVYWEAIGKFILHVFFVIQPFCFLTFLRLMLLCRFSHWYIGCRSLGGAYHSQSNPHDNVHDTLWSWSCLGDSNGCNAPSQCPTNQVSGGRNCCRFGSLLFSLFLSLVYLQRRDIFAIYYRRKCAGGGTQNLVEGMHLQF
jgi:hypothetical protein